ncbi:MAG: threonine synthase, partial [Chitinophagaceae bacterium]
MKYFSLNGQSEYTSFKEATIKGQAPDKGLYFPESIPTHSAVFFEKLKTMDKDAIGFSVMRPFVTPDIPDHILQQIIHETLDFDIPLKIINERIYSLELFHGPTMAFKDVGARFMSRCLSYFSKNNERKIIVLVATSGDTGGAVADGFFGVEGVEVVILYPSGKVSPVQELQLTTYGKNIKALEIVGDFDDCQRIVKTAFADEELTKKIFLTSANSINVARWLPQQIYYFLALKQWQHDIPPVISVPSGNFGNICAGILAWRTGLPVSHFIAACNANDVVPKYMQSGQYLPMSAVATISNAMDVGDPSNFKRILNIFNNALPDLKDLLTALSISDPLTEKTIDKVYRETGYLLDPHGAVGYAALEKYFEKNDEAKGIILETAHPVKFPSSVERIIGKSIPLPPQAKAIMNKKKESLVLNPNYDVVKEF